MPYNSDYLIVLVVIKDKHERVVSGVESELYVTEGALEYGIGE